MREEEQSRSDDGEPVAEIVEETVTEEPVDETTEDDEAEQLDDVTEDYEDIGEVEGEAEMRDMIGYIARVLVDDPEAVQVRSQWSDGRLNINLKVADDDKGKVIGRRGRVVHAMQSLLRVAATKSNMRAGIDVE